MRHQKLQISIIFLFGLSLSGLHAQNMYLRKTDGTQTNYAITSIRKMTFPSGNLAVSNIAGENVSYLLNELRYLNFKDLTLAVDHPLLQSQKFFVYPNPVSDILYLSIANTEQPLTHFEIISVEGRVLQQKDLNANNQLAQISLSELPRGLYFCKISNATTTQTIKFIKQ